ncbi:MAG: hypothetical protein CSB47_03755 [Proteobacteria bacterium]|nr:MAG: hypothetical protein CSB47_03755 [Pseudomonadota bacterium]
MTNLNCPSCGGAIEGVSPHIRSIDCHYCGAWIRLSNQLWQAEAGQETPLGAPSFFRVGMRGDAPDGTWLMVRGRIRFQYGMGTWDEWWLENSHGDGFWVEEDDGVYYQHAPGEEITLDASSSAGVGQMLPLPNGPNLFITEKFDATIIGREGMLPNEPEASSVITYIDGVADGDEYSLEIDGDCAYVSQSEIFPVHDIRWDQA